MRERRRPRMPNQIGPHIEQRVLAFSLAHPGCGPRRISAELAREKWGGLRLSEHGVWRVLKRHGLSTRTRRLALIAGYADAYERKPPTPPPERHIEASEPGEIVGIDCFYIGRLQGTKGTLWQYTAIDVASGYAWAELHTSERNPIARHTKSLVHRVATELAAAGWKLHAVISDNGSEFRSKEFTSELFAPGRRAPSHPRRATDLQRACRAPAADDPRGVLATGLRQSAGTEEHSAQAGPRAVPLRPITSTGPTPGA